MALTKVITRVLIHSSSLQDVLWLCVNHNTFTPSINGKMAGSVKAATNNFVQAIMKSRLYVWTCMYIELSSLGSQSHATRTFMGTTHSQTLFAIRTVFRPSIVVVTGTMQMLFCRFRSKQPSPQPSYSYDTMWYSRIRCSGDLQQEKLWRSSRPLDTVSIFMCHRKRLCAQGMGFISI
jgi:hypothetical protein